MMPLHIASIEESLQGIQILMQQKADVKLVRSFINATGTPIDLQVLEIDSTDKYPEIQERLATLGRMGKINLSDESYLDGTKIKPLDSYQQKIQSM